jgi:DNA-binding NarL/FixJ family response regulator
MALFRRGPLVGRESELARLAGAAGIPSGTGGIVVVAGDAGIGKSRLLAQLEADATDAGWISLVGHCVGQAGSALPYLPFIEALGAADTALPEVVDAVVAAHPSLLHLMSWRSADGTQSGSATGEVTNPGLIAEGVHACLSAIAARRPTLLLIEDAHWADHSSRDLLTLLFTRGFAGPIAVVVTYRSDDLHRRHPLYETLVVWSRLAQVGRIELGRLPDEAMRRLVAGLDGAPSKPEAVAALAARAEGNAFFAEELVANAAAGRALGEDLSRLLRLRVEQLDDPTQRALRAMAVFGRQVGHELLCRVLDLTPEALDDVLHPAVDNHTIEPVTPDGYAFRHALVAESVNDAVLPGERRRLHRAYAAVLAAQPRLGPASELARHSAGAGDLPTAIDAGRRAAEEALRMGGPHESLQIYDSVLTWMDEDHPDRDEVVLRAALAATAAGDLLRASSLLKDRLDHPGRAQSRLARAELLAAYAQESRVIDLPVDGLALTREAVGLLPPDRGAPHTGVLTAHIQALVDAGKYAEASVVADEVLGVAERAGQGSVTTEIRTIMTGVIRAEQDVGAVETHLLAVASDLTGSGDPIQMRVLHQLAALAHHRGNLRLALQRYDEGAALGRRLERPWAPWALECRLLGGLVAYELGEWDSALERLQPQESIPQPGDALFTAARLLVLAGRGHALDAAALDQLRRWWPVDSLTIVLTVMGGVDALGYCGRVGPAVDLAQDAVAALDRVWAPGYQGVVRLAALVAGQVAGRLSHADPDSRGRLLAVTGELTGRADAALAAASAVPGSRWSSPGSESQAWAVRLAAENLRLRWLTGTDPPDLGELTAAWEHSVRAFEEYGHVYETARSRARLAAVRHAAGDPSAAQVATAAREAAQRLGAAPLLTELDAIAPAPGRAAHAPSNGDGMAGLTTREVEVLRLVALGRSNGQIGKALFISTKTVSVHVSNILAKLDASSRGEAAAIARQRGLLT